MAFLGWQATAWLIANFAVDFIDSDIYTVQRLAIVSRNIVVGIFTLATGFSGVISLGIEIITGRFHDI